MDKSKSSKIRKRVGPLNVTEVRWFYKKAAEYKFVPFKGYDSVIIELRYRQKENICIEEGISEELVRENKENKDIIVMDGLYKLDEDSFAKILPIYWKNDEFEIIRGSWFTGVDMQPLSKEMAASIEKNHYDHFKDQFIPDGPVFDLNDSTKKPVLTFIKVGNDEVKWNSVIDIFLFSNTTTSKVLRYFSFSKGEALVRGYNEICKPEEGRPNFTDLVLVVHGIGQKGHEDLIAKNVGQMRELLTPMMSKAKNYEGKSIIMLPIEWRSPLKLDSERSSHVLLAKMSSFRESINAVAMDIMYYQSPLYRTEIVNGVIRQLNFVYKTFMDNNPSFKGKVSIFAHSLGSVIAFDILTGWSPLKQYDSYVTISLEKKMDSFNEGTNNSAKDKIKLLNYLEAKHQLFDSSDMEDMLDEQEEKLLFPVKTLFCVGSSLGVFLVMRGATPDTFKFDPAKLERIINIYHPLDPVAYRLEPLFHANYRHIKPLKLCYSTDEKCFSWPYHLPVEIVRGYQKRKTEAVNNNGDKEGIEEYDSDLSEASRPNSPFQQGSPSKTATPASAGNKQSPGWFKSKPNKGSASKKEEKAIDALETIEAINDLESVLAEVGEEYILRDRIDFQVQPSITEKSYYGMMTAHFSYWTNPDVISFMSNVLLNEHEIGFGKVKDIVKVLPKV
uniref:DDHD domain-containing protein n=1 Tax=Rhabditophanes sp. KR3021 TaxID=114890 RepID=A0AC35TZQ4_9BILA